MPPFHATRIDPAQRTRATIAATKDDLEIDVRKGTLVLRSHGRRIYRLEDLVKRLTPHNVHKELDFGRPVGRETP